MRLSLCLGRVEPWVRFELGRERGFNKLNLKLNV